MDAAVAALIGAGIGAIVPAAVAVASSRGQRQESREARLFDHRREAYTGFISEANAVASRMNDRYFFLNGDPPALEEDTLGAVVDLWTLVQLYGTQKSGELAGEAVSKLSQFVYGGAEKQNPFVYDYQIALEAFVAQARTDLGVNA